MVRAGSARSTAVTKRSGVERNEGSPESFNCFMEILRLKAQNDRTFFTAPSFIAFAENKLRIGAVEKEVYK